MTFKHINFGDSPVMRSLEKLALAKNPEKQESIEKTASNNKPDFTPTEDFFSNLTKLCSGLRDIGLSKYADELENNYLRYKHAQTAYETSKETGEDLVDQAHPKGSVQVGDGEYGIVETIVDQQLKTLKILDKKPTGKLASAKDIINAVKISLADEADEMAELERFRKLKALRSTAAINEVKKIGVTINTIQEFVSEYFGESLVYKSGILKHVQHIRSIVDNIAQSPDIRTSISDIIKHLNWMLNTTEINWKDFSVMFGLMDTSFVQHVGDITDIARQKYFGDKRKVVAEKINKCIGIANTALNFFDGKLDSRLQQTEEAKPGTTEVKPADASKKVRDFIGAALNKIRVLVPVINASGDINTKDAIEQINAIRSKLMDIQANFGEIPADLMTIEAANSFIAKATPYVQKLNELYNGWMK